MRETRTIARRLLRVVGTYGMPAVIAVTVLWAVGWAVYLWCTGPGIIHFDVPNELWP